MAFIVLNEEQIALLTEEQKKQYENELDIYNERAAFVERIKILEDIEIPLYEPKFQYINVIDEIPEKDFDKPEYKMKDCNRMPQIKLSDISFSGVKSICMALPEYSKRANIEVEHIKKIESTPLELPKVAKIKSTVQSFEQVESEAPILPNVKKMATESFVNFEKTLPDIVIQPINIFSINISDMSSISFIELKVENLILPEVMIAFDDIKGFDKIEQTSLKLPNIIKPNIDIEVEKVKPIQTVLPEWSNIEVVDYVFDKIELSNPKLPTILKPTIIEEKRTFAKYSVANLPIINPCKTELKSFKKPDYKEVELPVIKKVDIVDKVFKSVETPEIQTMIVPALIAPIRTFTKTESKVKGLPDKKIINIPDAYEKMTELLYEK